MKNDSAGLLPSDPLATSLLQTAVHLGHPVTGPAACVCDTASTSGADQGSGTKATVETEKKRRMQKIVAMYATMVVVSTCAIFFLEHASLVSAFRTALVAAVGKTFAANWVSSLFE